MSVKTTKSIGEQPLNLLSILSRSRHVVFMSIFKRWLDDFKPADRGFGKEVNYIGEFTSEDHKHIDTKEALGKDEYTNTTVAVKTEDGGVALIPEESGLKRNLEGRHLQLIALGGSIGTGLFIGAGETLATGGPGSLMLCFIIVAVLVIFTIYSLGELAAALPISGSFCTYSVRFIDPSWGFAMGWCYWMQWLVAFPLEATAATIVISFWDRDQVVPQGVWVTIYLVALGAIHFFGVRGYGEFEFFAALVKIIGCIGFIICCIVIDVGGAPSRHYFGAQAWHENDAFLNQFKGFCSVFITAAFAYSGAELVGIAAAETSNPRKAIPKATKQVIFRVLIFYILSLFMITLLVPATTPQLSGDGNDPSHSPFVLAIQMGQIHALPQIFNAVILISALSVGNASVFGGCRTLLSLAELGMAPKIFAYVDRKGRPLPAMGVSLLFGLLGYLIYASDPNTVFDWLLSISGLSVIFSWGSTCVAHIRFRQAWLRQGNTLRQLPFVSPLGTTGAVVGLILNILVLMAAFYNAAWPIGEGHKSGMERANDFFESMISLPLVLAVFIAHKLWTRSRYVRIDEIDVQTGRRDPVSEEVLEQERAEARARPLWRKLLDFIY